MADSPLNRIPSISQLMELRPLKDLAQRASSTAVAAGIKAYLEPYQRRALEAAPALPYASLQSLAADISSWILGERGLARPEVINASGEVLSRNFPVGPLADEVVVQAHARRHDYRLGSAQKDFQEAVEKLLCDLTGAEAVLILKDRPAAIYLTAMSSASRRTVVPRSQMAKTFDRINLPAIMEQLSGLQEVGASNRIDFDELRTDLANQAGRLFWFDRTNFDAPATAAIPSTAEAIAQLTSLGGPLWVDLGVAGLTRDALHEQLGLCSVQEALANGAAVAIAGGGFLFGGPACGLVFGSGEVISALRREPMAAYLQAATTSLAELEACLQVHLSGERVDDRIPVLSLLSTSLENLDLRATRLASQLAHSPWVEAAETRPADVQVLPGCQLMPTRQVVLTRKKNLPPERQSLEFLLETFPGIQCREASEEEIVLDLRAIFPRQDAEVVQKFMTADSSGEGIAAEKCEN